MAHFEMSKSNSNNDGDRETEKGNRNDNNDGSLAGQRFENASGNFENDRKRKILHDKSDMQRDNKRSRKEVSVGSKQNKEKTSEPKVVQNDQDLTVDEEMPNPPVEPISQNVEIDENKESDLGPLYQNQLADPALAWVDWDDIFLSQVNIY